MVHFVLRNGTFGFCDYKPAVLLRHLKMNFAKYLLCQFRSYLFMVSQYCQV